MNTKELEQFITRTEHDLAKAKAFLEVLQRRGDNLNVLIAADVELPAQQAKRRGRPPSDAVVSGIENVRQAIGRCGKRFTVSDVRGVLGLMEDSHDVTNLSGTLLRLAKAGELKIVKRGKGRQPSVYEVTPSRNKDLWQTK